MYLEKVVKPRASLSAKPKQMAALLKKRESEMEMTKEKAAAEIKRMRKQAGDESIPQEARNKMLDRANEIERMFYEKEKAAGMAKGGAVKKKPAMAKGGAVKKTMSYAKGGMAMCGASVPASGMNKGKK